MSTTMKREEHINIFKCLPRMWLEESSVRGLENYIEEIENAINNFDDEYLQKLQASRDEAAEILETKTTHKRGNNMPYQVLTIHRVKTLSNQELETEIDKLVAELEVHSAERYDLMCESLKDMRNEQGARAKPLTPDHYLVVAPRFNAGNRIYGPATLDACQYQMIKFAQADGFEFETDHQDEVNLQDNYSIDTPTLCMEINKLTPMPGGH